MWVRIHSFIRSNVHPKWEESFTYPQARKEDEEAVTGTLSRRTGMLVSPNPRRIAFPPFNSLASPVPLQFAQLNFLSSFAMAAQMGAALHAQQTCQLASFQGLRVTNARVQQQQQQQQHSPSQVSFSRRCLAAVRANSPSADGSTGDVGAAAAPSASKTSSILCQNCDGNGAVSCSQCHGAGLNTEDHFNGRFKAGTTCWLCRGKRQMLCGNCNGAGFMGGFMNTQDE